MFAFDHTNYNRCLPIYLTLSWRRRYHIEISPLLCKPMDWFLYDYGLRHEKVKAT